MGRNILRQNFCRIIGWFSFYSSMNFGACGDGGVAVLSAKLPHLDNWNTFRQARAKQYRKLLAEKLGLRLPHEFPRFAQVRMQTSHLNPG